MKSQQKMPIQILEEAKDSVTSIIISGSSIFTGCVDGHVRHYDVRGGTITDDFFEGEPLKTVSLEVHRRGCITAPVTSMVLTREGESLLVSTLDSTIRKVDLTNGTLLQKFRGHMNEKHRIQACLTDSERWLVSGDETGDLVTWDHSYVPSRSTTAGKGKVQETVPFYTREEAVDGEKSLLWVAAHPSPSAGIIATAGQDGSVRTWQRVD